MSGGSALLSAPYLPFEADFLWFLHCVSVLLLPAALTLPPSALFHLNETFTYVLQSYHLPVHPKLILSSCNQHIHLLSLPPPVAGCHFFSEFHSLLKAKFRLSSWCYNSNLFYMHHLKSSWLSQWQTTRPGLILMPSQSQNMAVRLLSVMHSRELLNWAKVSLWQTEWNKPEPLMHCVCFCTSQNKRHTKKNKQG